MVLQVVSGYSPLASGFALLPLTIIMLALSARSGQLAARIGPRLQMSVGPVVVGAGLAMLTLATSGSSYVLYVLPAVVVFGLGLAITVAPPPLDTDATHKEFAPTTMTGEKQGTRKVQRSRESIQDPYPKQRPKTRSPSRLLSRGLLLVAPRACAL